LPTPTDPLTGSVAGRCIATDSGEELPPSAVFLSLPENYWTGRASNFTHGQKYSLVISTVDRSLGYLKARFPDAEAWQISATGRKGFVSPEGIRVAPALKLLRRLI